MSLRLGEFVGNESVVASVQNLLDTKRFPRLIVIEGNVGTGRKTLADIIGQAAVCVGENIPCNNCSGCTKFFSGHPDVHFVNGGTKKSIGVDDIRDSIEASSVVPNEAPRRVFLVYNADTLTDAAQNALLKSVEDGPEDELFIFVCTSRFNLLETILSRAITFRLIEVSLGEATEYISKLREQYREITKPTASQKKLSEAADDQIKQAVELSGGNIGNAIGLLSGDSDELYRLAGELAQHLANADKAQFLMSALALAADKKSRADISSVVTTLSELLRDALVIKNGSNVLLHPAFKEAGEKMAGRYTSKQLSDMQSSATEIADRIAQNAPAKNQLAALCIYLFR